MPQLVEPDNLPSSRFTDATCVFKNTTIRQTVKVNLGSDILRIRITNEFGATPLGISRATVALSLGGSGVSTVDPASLQKVTFSGRADVTLPPSVLGVSDPIQLSVRPGDILSISLFLAKGQDGHDITGHPGSRTTSWLQPGDATLKDSLQGKDALSLDHWYYISAVEGLAIAKSICLIGDSITDGRGSTHNANNRWPDELWKRMQQDKFARNISPINLAAGGNRILNHGLGPSAWSRIARDVFSHSNVGYVLIFEGVNDIGTALPTEQAQEYVYQQLVFALDQIITQCKSFGIPVFGATICPFGSVPNEIQSYSHPLRESTRQRVNEWILNSGKYDFVVDFAAAVCDTKRPDYLLEKYDSGDFLHLNPEGLRRLAEAFDVRVFERFSTL